MAHAAVLGPSPGNAPHSAPGLPALRPIASYATCSYYATHGFRFVDAKGGSRYIRYTFVPEAGDKRISPREAKRHGPDYLQQEMRERLTAGPARFTLELQVAEPGDPVDDASSVWPRERQRVRAGTLEIDQLETDRETGGTCSCSTRLGSPTASSSQTTRSCSSATWHTPNPSRAEWRADGRQMDHRGHPRPARPGGGRDRRQQRPRPDRRT